MVTIVDPEADIFLGESIVGLGVEGLLAAVDGDRGLLLLNNLFRNDLSVGRLETIEDPESENAECG